MDNIKNWTWWKLRTYSASPSLASGEPSSLQETSNVMVGWVCMKHLSNETIAQYHAGHYLRDGEHCKLEALTKPITTFSCKNTQTHPIWLQTASHRTYIKTEDNNTDYFFLVSF